MQQSLCVEYLQPVADGMIYPSLVATSHVMSGLVEAPETPDALSPPPYSLILDRLQYTDESVSDCLAEPAGYTGPTVFEAGPNTDQTQAAVIPSQKVYEGPFYLQGGRPTCAPWAIVHAMKVVGAEPPHALVKDLLNAAMPKTLDDRAGMNFLHVVAALYRNEASDVTVELPATPADMEGFIQRVIDTGSALIAVVLRKEDAQFASYPGQSLRHAVCIAGYKIDAGGSMHLQIIDSARGAYAQELGAFMFELDDTVDGFHPLAVITKKEAAVMSDGQLAFNSIRSRRWAESR